jgi:hypothetical protein
MLSIENIVLPTASEDSASVMKKKIDFVFV